MATVLIADKQEHMAKYLSDILEDLHHATIGLAHDGSDVVRMYWASRPDIVILNTNTPGLPTDKVLGKILDCDPSAIVVVTCPEGSENLAEEACASGARGSMSGRLNRHVVEKTMGEIFQKNTPFREVRHGETR